MKTKDVFALLAFLLVFVSCAREEFNESNQNASSSATTIVVELEGTEGVRTTLDPEASDGVRHVFWSDGDQVNANGCVSRPLSGVAGSSRATFQFDDLLSLPYNIMYPASMYKENSRINIPATQAYTPGSFASGTAPSVGVLSDMGSPLTLKNLSAILKLSVKGTAGTSLKQIVFRGGNDEQLCGEFEVDYANASLTAQPTPEDSTLLLTLDLGSVALSDVPTDFYLVLPPANYEKGFFVDFVDVNDQVMKVTKSAAIHIEKGKIIIMPTVVFDSSMDKVADFDEYYETEMLFSGGRGTAEDPYLISSDWDLREMADYINNDDALIYRKAHYKQVADINLSKYENFTPIGISSDYNFQGVYDGGNYIIAGLTIDNTLERGSALFGNSGTAAVFKNINLPAVSVTSTYGYASALVSYAYASKIENCSATGTVTTTGNVDNKSYTGGLIGRVYGATVDGCSFRGNVTAKSNHTGGIIGQSDGNSNISNCILVKGSVVTCNYYGGGIVGSFNGANGSIRSCVCEGKVITTGWNAGGITSALYQGTVASCVQSNTSVIESSNYNVGGIVGAVLTSHTDKNRVAKIDNCVSYGVVKGAYQVAGICGLCHVANEGETGIISNCAAIDAEITALGVNSYNYSLVAGICGWLQGSGDGAIVNCFSRPTFVNSTSSSSQLGTAAILGYTNSTTHVVENCYTPVSSSEIRFGGAPVSSSSLTFYGSILGRATAAASLTRCYHNQTFRMAPTTSSSQVTSNCVSYTLSQMTSGILLDRLNSGLGNITVATPSTWVAGDDNFPTLTGLPQDSQPRVVKKRVSIIGDSISTFSGWISSTRVNGKSCTTHYPNTNHENCDVLTVDKTWWYRLIYNYMKNAQFEMNISSGNTTVVKNTTASSYATQYWYNWDFCTRFIGYAGVGNPDIIFIHGGTNDLGHITSYGASEKLTETKAMNSSAGPTANELKPLFDTADACTSLSQAEALDFSTFCSAYIKLLQMIKVRYPEAKVVCIIGDAVSAGMQSAIKSIATHYNAKYVDFLELNGFKGSAPLSKYDNSVHPDAAGMEYMAKTIYSQLGSWLEE